MAKDDYFVIVYQILSYLSQRLKKGEPIATTITVTDLSGKTITGALAAVYDKRSSARVWPEANGTFQLVEGLSYTCVATCSGYVGDTQEIAAGKAEEIVISLAAAPDMWASRWTSSPERRTSPSPFSWRRHPIPITERA